MPDLDQKSIDMLDKVHPDLRKVILQAAADSPIRFRLTEGLRTKERQAQLVKIGASKTMKSRHITGHAVDLVPLVDLDGDGKIETEELYSWPLMRKLAVYIYMAAKKVHIPVEWGGDWTKFPDGPHWQLPAKIYP